MNHGYPSDLRPASQAPVWKDPWITRRMGFVLLIATSALAAVVLFQWSYEQRHEQALVAQQSRDLVNLQFELLQLELQQLESDVMYLSNQDTLRATWEAPDPTAARQVLANDYVRFARAKPAYDQIRLLDMDGRELLRVNNVRGNPVPADSSQLQAKTGRYYYRQSMNLERGEVLVSPFDLNIENGEIEEPHKPVIRVITPVYDSQDNKRGVLVLNYLGQRILQKLSDVSIGARGNPMLVNHEGEYLFAPRGEQAWGWMLGHHESCSSRFRDEWPRLVADSTGQFVSPQGVFTFRWFDPLAESVGEKMALPVKPTLSGPHPSAMLVVYFVEHSQATRDTRKLLVRLIGIACLALAITAALAWTWARATYWRRLQEQRIVESEARLRKLSSQLLMAQESERRSISRQLHDEIGQLVTAASLDVRSASYERDAGRREELLRQATCTIDELLRSLHRIASRVRPFILDDLGLHDALESHITDYERRTGIHVTAELKCPRLRIPPAIADHVYRIVLEALANIAKHSQATEATVTLAAEHETLQIRVRDEGIGFRWDERNLNRLGLLGMQERTELLGGTFQLESSPGGGTTVNISIPLRGFAEPDTERDVTPPDSPQELTTQP